MSVQNRGRSPRSRSPQPCIDVTELETELARHYPEAQCTLHHHNAYELLVATVLSAQTTDERVNTVTGKLFSKYPDAAALAAADPTDIASLIRSLGFQKRRSTQLSQLANALLEHHNGQVPDSRAQLIKLAGVGRKTANVVLGNSFHQPALTVDTHVGRLSHRMGLSEQKTPLAIERDLAKKLTQSDWTVTCHRLIAHGRSICTARRAHCQDCFLDTCPRIGITAS